MKFVTKRVTLFSIFAFAFLTFACGGSDTPSESDSAVGVEENTDSGAVVADQAEPTEAPPEPTEVPTEMPTATAVPTDPPSPTPIPPTETLAPTNTPEPTEIPPTATPEAASFSIETEDAILYAAPGDAAESVGELSSGDSFVVSGLSADQSWLEVEMENGDAGWLSLEVLELEDDARADLVSTFSDSVQRYGASLTANVNSNVREEPILYAPRIGSLPEGESAEIIGVNDDYSWYQIRLEGEDGAQVGWIYGEIVDAPADDELLGIPRNDIAITYSPPVVQVPAAPAESGAESNNSGGGGGGGEAVVAAPPPAASPDNLYNPVNNPAFAGWGRISQGAGQAQRGGCRGMTWTLFQQIDGVVHVGTDLQTNPYGGDVTCDATLPILCFLPDGSGPPSRDDQVDYVSKWAPGRVALTGPVNGYQITSKETADQLCAGAFGSGFARVAEFHEGNYGNSGWNFWSYGNLPVGTRFWVAIRDQPANPWNSQ